MRILIVSYESWRDTNNGGNVLSNIFCVFPDAQIAQIYCSGEQPENAVCRKYFQISDTMLITGPRGRKLPQKDYSTDTTEQKGVIENQIKDSVPPLFREISLLAREFLWMIFPWKTETLKAFVEDFKPDIIFAPCYSYFHVSKLALHVKHIAKCPMISYISDDNYSLKQFRFSPSFWINRLITRKWIRRLFAECSLVYTMTELQKEEYARLLKCKMKVLCKSAMFASNEKTVGSPVQFIYAGGLYLNRWKILARLSEVLKNINKDQVKAQLHIFSGSKLNAKQETLLHDGENSFLHEAIPFAELVKRYKESDVAIHVESFDLKNRLKTRLSFSTKIIDCMSSGCAILAIGPDSQAGIAYLKDNDAAVCVSNLKDLQSIVRNLVNNPDTIKSYAEKAKQLGQKNHNKTDIEKMIRRDFDEIASVNNQNNDR